MNHKLEERLKQEFTRRRPSIRFGERLGEGAFSITFGAWDGHVPCAVKFSRDPWTHDPGVAKEREALLKTMLDCNGHPHIASFFFVDDDVCGHLATVWERGEMSLQARLDHCLAQALGPLPLDELLLYMEHAAEGLDFMHAKGIVHRDIKPDNLLLVRGQVKLIDFGFARFADMRSAVNSVRGTPVFAPPEAGDERLLLEPQYDIYCLAGTFIRLATGQFPFGAGDDLRARKARGSFHTEGLARQHVEALSIALAANPRARRFPTATALVRALRTAPSPVVVGTPVGAPTNATRPASSANTAGNSFRDRIQALAAHEQLEIDRSAQARDEQRVEFHRLLDQQLAAKQLPLAYGTVLALLRDDAKNDEYLEVRKFLEQTDTRNGRPRCCDEIGMRYVLIPSGEFTMGSPGGVGADCERPQHRVRITKSFMMGMYPVTVGQFRDFVDATGYSAGEKKWLAPEFSQTDAHPVVYVSRDDALAMTKWLSAKTSWTYSLPTEAEWEYACRAGTTTLHYGGDSLEWLATNANTGGSVKGTTPVGKYPPNQWGLYDMLGNCWEWTLDRYAADYYRTSPQDDPTGPPNGDYFSYRGGSWYNSKETCRSACRGSFDASLRVGNSGFRVLLRLS